MAFRIAQYGRGPVALATLLLAAATAGVMLLAWRSNAWLAGLVAVPVAVWVWVLWFFRDPHRTPPQGEGLLVSCADGRVADITPIGPESELGRPGVRVGVFMNVLNVHVNRSPCDGRVEEVLHRPGRYLDARDPHASEHNESASIRLACEHRGASYPVVVRQVAGYVARRIVTDLVEGQTLRRGQRIGMIRFGSRLEVLAPTELAAEVRVAVGDAVRAGETVLLSAGDERT